MVQGSGVATLETVRITEFWELMNHHLGSTYAATWARDQVLAPLGQRTVIEALDAGWETREVWRAVGEALELPKAQR